MSREIVRNSQYTMIGVIDTEADGKRIARDAQFSRLGEYDPKTNITRDVNFSVVGTGNQLAALIWQAAD
ncbi:hypothetical protein [Burkholderia sp. S171]|uniref:hypothetical protein n=1 Tax=Burkholderia sp. S171 TaxID=1641860 RepID=UPI00131A6F9C|nr:hypothetical protein [Burkholderia sp. S171]